MNVQMARLNVQTMVQRDKSNSVAAVCGVAKPTVRTAIHVIARERTVAATSITPNNVIIERHKHVLMVYGITIQHVLRIRFAAAVRVNLAQVVSMFRETAV